MLSHLSPRGSFLPSAPPRSFSNRLLPQFNQTLSFFRCTSSSSSGRSKSPEGPQMTPRSSRSQHQSFLTDWASQSVHGPPYPARPHPLRFWRRKRLTTIFFQTETPSSFDSRRVASHRPAVAIPFRRILTRRRPLPTTRSSRRSLRPTTLTRNSPLGPTFPNEKPCRGHYIKIRKTTV